MNKKIRIVLIFLGTILLVLTGCGSSDKSVDIIFPNMAEFYGEYTFDEVAYLHKTSGVSEEQYQSDLMAVTDTFIDAEFIIDEGYFYETSGTFGKIPSEGFDFITMDDYGDKYYDKLAGENLENFEGLGSIFDYDDIKKELGVNEIKHYIMYEEDGILSNPAFYITKDHIFVAMDTISWGETEYELKGYTHYLLKLKEKQ